VRSGLSSITRVQRTLFLSSVEHPSISQIGFWAEMPFAQKSRNNRLLRQSLWRMFPVVWLFRFVDQAWTRYVSSGRCVVIASDVNESEIDFFISDRAGLMF